LLLSLCLPLSATAEAVQLDGRYYEIFLPAYPSGAPLILALHGGGGNPDQFATASGFGRAATRAGYAVVFAAGSGRRGDKLLTWNAGYCCGYAVRKGIDDTAFFVQLIADASERFSVDGEKVYLTGMSNGSMMSEAFAARKPDKVRAVAGVAGTVDTSVYSVGGKVPALIIHGTADTMVPYDGGKGDQSLTRVGFASAASVVAAFLDPWGGGVTKATTQIDRWQDGTSVKVTNYRQDGAVVLRLMTVNGGAHHWPGGSKAR